MTSETASYQKENIVEPGENDVMFGRGGGTNNHSGNIKFRKLCMQNKFKYLAASKVDKPKVAREVVAIWRNQDPPGRFITKASRDNSKGQETLWRDVGDQKAREKASQCLRERTPEVMPFLQQLQKQGSGQVPQSQPENYSTIDLNEFDNAAIAVALLNKQVNGEESPLLTAYLKKIAEAPKDDEMSLDENASVTAIAKAIFKNSNNDSDDMSIVEFLQSDDKLIGDLDSIFSDAMSKYSWARSFNMDPDQMTTHSLGRIGVIPETIESGQQADYAKSNNGSESLLSEVRSVSSSMSRASKMKAAKKGSNMSMLSELTDMTGTFSNLDI